MKEERDFVCELLDNVSKRLGKPYKYLVPFEEELKKNWYDSPEALRKASDSEFEKMNIPLRVATAIREELGLLEPQKKKQPPPPITRQPSNKSAGQEKGGQKKLTQASMLESIRILENELMVKYPWVGQELLKILETLLKVVKNILSDPFELKFRVLKKANNRIREVVVENQPVKKFLQEIGFEQDEETFTLHRFETHELYFIEEGLQAVVVNHQTQNAQSTGPQSKKVEEKSPFLPADIKFPESKQSTTLETAFSKQQLQEANYAEILDKLVQYRNQLMSQPPANRQLRIYHKRFEVRQVEYQECDMQREIELSDNSVLAKYWKNVLRMSRNTSNFQSRRKIEFEYLIKQKIYRETVIKLRLPNELIIEAKFGPLEPLQEVFNLASMVVAGDIYLYQSPPVKRLDKQMGHSLESLHSVPGGSFYLGISTEWYIKNEYARMVQM